MQLELINQTLAELQVPKNWKKSHAEELDLYSMINPKKAKQV